MLYLFTIVRRIRMTSKQQCCIVCKGEALHKQVFECLFCSEQCKNDYYTPIVLGKKQTEEHSKPLVVTFDMDSEMENNDEPLDIIYTDENLQFAIERVEEDGSIAKEIHPTQTQFIRLLKGDARIDIYYPEDTTKLYKSFNLSLSRKLHDTIIIHAGTYHEVVNIGKGYLSFYTIYAPHVH